MYKLQVEKIFNEYITNNNLFYVFKINKIIELEKN